MENIKKNVRDVWGRAKRSDLCISGSPKENGERVRLKEYLKFWLPISQNGYSVSQLRLP